MADINDILSLAELLAEATGASMDAALKNMLSLSRSTEAPEPAPEPATAPEPQPILRRFNEDRFVAFLDRAPVGAVWTAPAICDRLGMAFPPYAKHPAQTMMRHGWVAIGILSGCRLYRKQPVVVADAAQ